MRPMVMDPATTSGKDWGEQPLLDRFPFVAPVAVAVLLSIALAVPAAFSGNVRELYGPLWTWALWIAVAWGLLWAGIKTGTGAWFYTVLKAVIEERLRPKPKAYPMAFAGGLPLSPFRIPWRLVLVGAMLLAVVTAVLLAGHAIRSAEARAVAAQEATEIALSRARMAEERASLAEMALTLADATNRAQEAAETIVADAVTVIRYVPVRPRVQPSPADPSQPSLPPVLPDAIPDPVPVFADAVASLLNDPGGLLPSPS